MHRSNAPHSGEGKRVALWIRVSTEDQARGESPQHHEFRGRMYAEAKGWTVVTVYHLEGVSGKAVSLHPEAKRMKDDVEAGAITGLIFSKLARLARSTKELLEFSEFFREQNADLISLQESIDTSTPAGRLFYTIIAAMAQWEREEISERIAASVPVRAKLGKRIAGAAPYGYTWKDGKLVPDEKEAPVRRLMYELFRDIRRVRTVARLLNERGFRTRGGRPFTHCSVRRLILDTTAKGLRRANYTKSLGEGRGWMRKPESEWVELPIPAIVDEALWNECTSILDERREGKRPGRRPIHLFTGYTFCHCGKKMYVPSNTPKWTCYGCRNKIPTRDLEEIFAGKLKDYVFSPDSLSEHLDQAEGQIGEKNALLETLLKEDEGVRIEAEKLYRLYLDGGLSAAGFKEKNDPLEARREALGREIPRLRAEIDFLRVRTLSSSEIFGEAQNLYGRWESLAFQEKRLIVEALVERITVGDGEVEISLAAAPDFGPSDPNTPTHNPPSPLKSVAERERTLTGYKRQEAKTWPDRRGGRGLGRL